MNWKLACEIVGFIVGVSTFTALILTPMFYLGNKIDGMRRDLAEIKGRLSLLEERNK
jgi:hypothetical protein